MLRMSVRAPHAELVIQNDSPQHRIPPPTYLRLPRSRRSQLKYSPLAYENVYSFDCSCGCGVHEFVSPWLVGMSERATGQPRVGGGSLHLGLLSPNSPNLATKLVIGIDVMQVLPRSMFDDVFAWLQALEYPWLSVTQALQSIPNRESLSPIAAFLAAIQPMH